MRASETQPKVLLVHRQDTYLLITAVETTMTKTNTTVSSNRNNSMFFSINYKISTKIGFSFPLISFISLTQHGECTILYNSTLWISIQWHGTILTTVLVYAIRPYQMYLVSLLLSTLSNTRTVVGCDILYTHIIMCLTFTQYKEIIISLKNQYFIKKRILLFQFIYDYTYSTK